MAGYVKIRMASCLARFLFTTCLDNFVKLHVSLCWLWVIFTSSGKTYFLSQNPYWLNVIYVTLYLQFLAVQTYYYVHFSWCYKTPYVCHKFLLQVQKRFVFFALQLIFVIILWNFQKYLPFRTSFFSSTALSNLNSVWKQRCFGYYTQQQEKLGIKSYMYNKTQISWPIKFSKLYIHLPGS